MNHVKEVQQWLRSTPLDGLIVPSTDEFLSEFPPAANRRLLWVTGFRGSTGVAVILREAAALFVDGRYMLQAGADLADAPIWIEPTALTSRRAWLQRNVAKGSSLGCDARLHSMLDMAAWQQLATELGIGVHAVDENPIDRLWTNRPAKREELVADYPERYAGQSYQAKCAALIDHVRSAGMAALLLADPEDVSWLLNVRAGEGSTLRIAEGDWPVVPACRSRALVRRNGEVYWFVDVERLMPPVAARAGLVVAPHSKLATALIDAAREGPVGADLRRTPAALGTLIEQHGTLCADDTVARCRWHKHVVELQAAREAHIVDAAAVVRLMAWLTHTVPKRTVNEIEAAERLQELRAQNPAYKGPSMPFMAASGRNGAQPHYVPHRGTNRNLNDHPIFWIDSGGQYFGGTTDNTITLAVGTPEQKHVTTHTLVLKGFLALATARVPAGTPAVRLDPIARLPLWREGMDYPHGTGHGVGSFLNIHEPPTISREPGPTTSVPIEAGMIITNEPGCYFAGDFGVRIESHMIVIPSSYSGFVEFETISRLPIDPRLVDFGRLELWEREWLADYHRIVQRDVQHLLDPQSGEWLRELVSTFVRAAGAD